MITDKQCHTENKHTANKPEAAPVENRIFDLISLIIEGVHKGSEPFIIEQRELLVDFNSAHQTTGISRIIVMDSEVTEQGDNMNLSINGSIITKSDAIQSFTLFYALNRTRSADDLIINKSGLWAINIEDSLNNNQLPLVLHDSIFNLELHARDRYGIPYFLGVGRGFLILGEREELGIH